MAMFNQLFATTILEGHRFKIGEFCITRTLTSPYECMKVSLVSVCVIQNSPILNQCPYLEMLERSPNSVVRKISHGAEVLDYPTGEAAIKASVGKPWALIYVRSKMSCLRMKFNQHAYYLPPSSDDTPC